MMLLKSLASLCILAAVAFAVPAQEKRIHHHADLSDHAHDDAHSFQYDHEAFLGKEEAKTFDQLTPEESKDRLAKIVDRIDTDKDGYISHAELHYWIKHRQRRYIEENVNKHWKDYDKNQDGKIGWEEYKNTTYGFYLDEEFDDVEDKATYKSMLIRDERRFKTADRDSDGIATREEFTAFLHPEEFDYMKDVVVLETVEDIDKNGDGKVNLDEYIGDMYTPENGESEPDWVQTERKHFSEFRDANKDGYLDAGEVAHWILPGEVDHADNEAKHLIHETDTDKVPVQAFCQQFVSMSKSFFSKGPKDGQLALAEILNKMDYIKTSTITDYGAMGVDDHDEL